MRRVLGTAHTSPGRQACAGRKIRRPAKNRAASAPAIKNGRYGSSRVRFPIHAPLKPRPTKTRGPRQQVEAKMAAKPPTKRAPDPLGLDSLSLVPVTFVIMRIPPASSRGRVWPKSSEQIQKPPRPAISRHPDGGSTRAMLPLEKKRTARCHKTLPASPQAPVHTEH